MQRFPEELSLDVGHMIDICTDELGKIHVS